MRILNSLQKTAWVSLFSVCTMVNTVAAKPMPNASGSNNTNLAMFIKNSLTGHVNLIAAKADVMSARAALMAAKQAIYNPELQFEYEDAEVKMQTIGYSQTIDWGDQQGSRTSVSQAELNQVMANYDMTMQSFIRDLLVGLAANQTQKELEQLSSQTLGLMSEFKSIAERRHNAGDLNKADLNLARLAYNQSLMERANAQSNAIEALENLRALLGGLPTSLPPLPEQLPEPVLKKELDAFLKQLPIIKSQMAQVNVARQEVALRKSEKSWDPTVSVTAGTEGDESLIGLNLAIPLNIRNNFSAEVDVAFQKLVANEQRAQLAFRDTRASLIITTKRYQNLLNAWNHWRDHSQASVNQQLVLIKNLWNTGDISASDYVLQLKQALEAQATGFELRDQLWRVAFKWMTLTASIDNWLNINVNTLELKSL